MARPHAPYDLEITIDSAKDLKNVNWKNGDLRPYVVVYIDPAVKMSTKVASSGDTDPRWGDKLVLPVPRDLPDAVLHVEIYHEKASDPGKAIVGKAMLSVMQIVDAGGFDELQEYKLKLKRPSGRPQGKLQISARLREKRMPPPSSYPTPYGQANYNYGRPPSAEARDWQGYPPSSSPYPAPYGQAMTPQSSYPAPQSSYPAHSPQSSYAAPQSPYAAPAPNYAPYAAPYAPQRPPYVASAPVNPQPPAYYQGSASSGYGAQPVGQDPQKKVAGSKFGGMGAGLAVGALAGAVGALALGEYVEHEKNEAAENQAEQDEQRFEAEEGARDDYCRDDYGGDNYGGDDYGGDNYYGDDY